MTVDHKLDTEFGVNLAGGILASATVERDSAKSALGPGCVKGVDCSLGARSTR